MERREKRAQSRSFVMATYLIAIPQHIRRAQLGYFFSGASTLTHEAETTASQLRKAA
jgi:hypothetical protein